MRIMGKMLYLECSSGISGDMAVAALLDAGASEEAVRKALASLPVDGFEVRIGRVVKSGLDVCDFDVVLDAAHENHDHDMTYLHGQDHGFAAGGGRLHECIDVQVRAGGRGEERVRADERACGRPHEHAHGCDQADAHARAHAEGRARGHAHDGACGHSHEGEDGYAHAHEHRGLAEVAAILDAADLTDGARSLARRVFEIIAQAEAEAHGVPVDQVHFHEVGAVDSIADIVAAAVALDDLSAQGVSDVVVTELAEGRGTVRCQHGLIPVPAPAVVNIVRAAALPLRFVGVDGELVTPTGAAIAAAARTRSALPERFTVDRVGMGAGKRAYDTPGILRALVIDGA